MSTVPKLTYAKVGKGSKAKAESVSSELIRSNQEKGDDIFSHMNQANLNYIKKQLKLKKNRSEHERSRSPERDPNEGAPDKDEEITQRYKLYQKYRGDEQVSEKQPHLEDTQRRSQSDKQVAIILPEQIEQDYEPSDHHNSKPFLVEKQFLATSQQGINPGKLIEKMGAENKMYQSLPYEDGTKRISSIEGYFGQAISTNLNRQEGLFIEFLQEYICDLNHSKHLKSRDNEQMSMEKRRKERLSSQRKKTTSREGEGKRNNSKIQLQLQQNKKKLDRLNRNSDPYGEDNVKYSVKSRHSRAQDNSTGYSALEQNLKEEKLNTLLLAQEIERQRKLLVLKEQIIKKLETDKDLLEEELRHVKIQQSIMNKNKTIQSDMDNIGGYDHRYRENKINDENELKMFELAGHITHNHHRHTSTNPQKTAYSYRSSVRQGEEADIFQQFNGRPHNYGASRQKEHSKKGMESLHNLKKEYYQFVEEQLQEDRRSRRGRRGREGVF